MDYPADPPVQTPPSRSDSKLAAETKAADRAVKVFEGAT
jgi:hypothetical protein